MKVTLGGDRLGSGNKNKIALRNYERSTHNLSQKWTSSMTVGALYPFLVLPAMRGDKFEIDLAAAARTIPTQGPLFGSFKMQLDIFQCPIRLYQAILHNNPTNIGLQMNQVKFPKIKCASWAIKGESYTNMAFSNSCLMKYAGVSGLFRHISAQSDANGKYVYRDFNAIPILAYYDIFKNYYSNKQEENAYVIAPKANTGTTQPLYAVRGYDERVNFITQYEINKTAQGFSLGLVFDKEITFAEVNSSVFVQFTGYNDGEIIESQSFSPFSIYSQLDGISGNTFVTNGLIRKEYDEWSDNEKSKYWSFTYYLGTNSFFNFIKLDLFPEIEDATQIVWKAVQETYNYGDVTALSLNAFKLKNIDDMRMKLLSWNNIGSPFIIDPSEDDTHTGWGFDSGSDQTGLPYKVNATPTNTSDKKAANTYPLNGLMVKTYQSDLFNNWIQTEWIDGENGIAAITAIDTSDGSFSIDTLNLSEKLYNMLNRIAVSGGTYEDWQDAVYMESPKRHMESPIYLGGMSTEVVFEEIIQSAPTEGNPLGTLGGRGILVKRKGGHVNVKVDEASFIIGIVSLTPRLNYSQGNEWYMTELDSMDDLHKPALDGIGFQNLMAEQLAWFGTYDTASDGSAGITRETIGKIPAWINYMTAVDKVYGDLAEGKNSFMVLNRNYEHGEHGGISDVTTYIDPTKYNYAFAYKELDAQNFWVQIGCDIKARRLMSAKQIPNI